MPWGSNNGFMDVVVGDIDILNTELATRVLHLQRLAYRVEADLIGYHEIPPLVETLEELMSADLRWCGAFVDGELVAAMATTSDNGAVDIDRLVVAPAFARRGLGSSLIDSLGTECTLTVSTGARNTPARRLYESKGFAVVAESSPAPGLSITHFVREAGR